jgi:thermostable 8-oxoguanine DNA glycosylase
MFNIKMHLKETGCEGVDWIYLAQDRDKLRALANTVIYFRVQKKARNFLTTRVSKSSFPEDGGSMFLRNVGIYLQVNMALQPRRPISTRQE